MWLCLERGADSLHMVQLERNEMRTFDANRLTSSYICSHQTLPSMTGRRQEFEVSGITACLGDSASTRLSRQKLALA